MGEDLPDEWPDLDPVKWYCVHVDQFRLNDCAGALDAAKNNCIIGATINHWIDNDNDCTPPFLLIPPGPVGSCQRITAILGPYDTEVLCDVDCP